MTGEVLTEVETKVVQFPQEPPYVKMYIEDLCMLVGVADADQALLRHLLVRLDYEGFVAITPRIRESIAKSLNITPKTIRNRLNNLVKADLIKPIARNDYRVNPRYFARGKWKEVCEQRIAYSMKITYTEKGRSITTESKNEEQVDWIDAEKN